MERRPVPRALLTGALCVMALASCAPSQGVAAPPEQTLSGIGVTPEQLGGEGVSLPTAPPATKAIPIVDIPPLTDPRVFMVGDSVLLGTTQGNPDALDLNVGLLGWDLTVDARVSRFTDEGLDVLRKRRDEIHEVVVVVLGNNYSGDEAEFARQVDEILELLDDTRLIVWLTVPEYAEKQREVNDILRNASGFDPRLKLIDWEAYSRADPAVLSNDGIHPTGYGATVIAQLIGLTLGYAPGSPRTVPLPVIGSTERPVVPAAGEDKGEEEPSIGTNPQIAATTTTRARPVSSLTTSTTIAPSTTSGGVSTSSPESTTTAVGTTAPTEPPPTEPPPTTAGP